MTTTTHESARDRMSHTSVMERSRKVDKPRTKELLVAILAFLLVIALLTLAAALAPVGIPGEPVWQDWPIV